MDLLFLICSILLAVPAHGARINSDQVQSLHKAIEGQRATAHYNAATGKYWVTQGESGQCLHAHSSTWMMVAFHVLRTRIIMSNYQCDELGAILYSCGSYLPARTCFGCVGPDSSEDGVAWAVYVPQEKTISNFGRLR